MLCGWFGWWGMPANNHSEGQNRGMCGRCVRHCLPIWVDNWVGAGLLPARVMANGCGVPTFFLREPPPLGRAHPWWG